MLFPERGIGSGPPDSPLVALFLFQLPLAPCRNISDNYAVERKGSEQFTGDYNWTHFHCTDTTYGSYLQDRKSTQRRTLALD